MNVAQRMGWGWWIVMAVSLSVTAYAQTESTTTEQAQGPTATVGASVANGPKTVTGEVINITPSQTSASGEALRISMNLQDAQLRDVLKVFSQQSRLNIIAAKEVEDQRVTLFLENVAVQDALQQSCSSRLQC